MHVCCKFCANPTKKYVDILVESKKLLKVRKHMNEL